MKDQTLPLLAIDGGGTKTLAVITNSSGIILGKGLAGASNYHGVGEEGAVQALQTAIQVAFADVDESYVNVVRFEKAVFALAGVDTTLDEERVKKIVNKVLTNLSIEVQKLYVENDCLSAMLGATNHLPGGLVIAGTGSIAFAHDGEGRIVRVGGWGHLVGDEGSGYWIGRQAIEAVLKMHDGREKKSLLHDLMLKYFGFKTADQLYDWIYSNHFSVNQIGKLTFTVQEAFLQGDPISKRIFDQASEQLARLVITSLMKMNRPENCWKFALQGGILQHITYIQERVVFLVKKEIPQVDFLLTKEEAITYIIKRGLA